MCFRLKGSLADSVTYGDLGSFDYGDGAPACHRVMPESPEAIMINFWLYTTSNPKSPQQIVRTSATSITNSNFDASRDTKIIIHGYLDFYFMPWHQAMKDAFLTHVRTSRLPLITGLSRCAFPQRCD